MSLVMPGDELRCRTITLDGTDTDSWAELTSGLVVPTYAAPPEPAVRPIAVDLFCGAGGMSLGVEQGGMHVAAANESDFYASCTYLANLGGPDTVIVVLNDFRTPGRKKHTITEGFYRAGDVFENAGTGWIAKAVLPLDHEPGSCATHIDDERSRVGFCQMYCGTVDGLPLRPCEVFYLGDVRRLRGKDILDHLDAAWIDCVVGGPPCQGFSQSNSKSHAEKRHDPRNELVFEFVRLVLECNAKTMIMENVPAIASMLTAEGVPVIDALSMILADGGFSTYDALRKSLRANAGAAGAIRQPKRDADRVDEDDDEIVDDEDQLALFGAPA